MNSYNGFHINKDAVKTKKIKFNYKRFLKNPLLKGALVLVLIFALVLTFLNVVPLKKVTVVEKCVMSDTLGNKEISYYNKQGKIEKTEQYNGDLKYSHKIYTYNKDGQIEKVENYYNDILFDTVKYSYADGLLIEKINEGTEGKLFSKTVYTYTQGTLALSTVFDEENNAVSETQYIFEKERCMQTKEITLSDSYTVITDYVYNGSKVEKETRTADNGMVSTVRYTYDKYSNVLSKTSAVNDYCLYTYTYTTRRVPVL